MAQEEKQILLKDLCSRLSYGVIVKYHNKDFKLEAIDADSSELFSDGVYMELDYDDIKPYLRPMSSMTEEEKNEYTRFRYVEHHEWDGHSTYTEYVEVEEINNYFDWLNKNMFDYLVLIPMGLALEAPEDMYK